MTFKQRPYDPDRPTRQTDAQRKATIRNFSIFQLRGLWSRAALLQEPYRTAARVAIDADLMERGALNQREHENERRREMYAKRGRQICPDCKQKRDFCDCIPF